MQIRKEYEITIQNVISKDPLLNECPSHWDEFRNGIKRNKFL